MVSGPRFSSRTPPLVGRAEVLSEAQRLLFGGEGGGPPLLLIVAEGGLGKTIFLGELVGRARDRNIFVLESRALPSETPQPFLLLQELLLSASQEPSLSGGPSGPLSEMGLAGIGASGRGVATSGGYLGLLPFSTPTESAEERENRLFDLLVRGAPEASEGKVQLFDRVASHLEDLPAGRTLWLVLDDLHQADPASLDFLDYFLQRNRNRGSVRVVASSLPDTSAPARFRQRWQRWGREGLLRTLLLRPFTEIEARTYLSRLSDRPIPEALFTRWFTLSEGNPVLLEQLARSEGPMGSSGGGPGSASEGEGSGPFPRTRFLELSDPLRRILAYASVFGGEFAFPLLLEATGEDEEALAEGVDELVRQGFLRERGGEVYEFAEEGLRAAVYTAMTEMRRRILHRKVARALQADPRPEESKLSDLARHFYLAQEEAPALDYSQRAAEQATAARDHASAIVHWKRALELVSRRHPPAPDLERRLRMQLALSLEAAGEPEQARRLLEDLLGPGRDSVPGASLPETGRTLLALARVLSHLGDWKGAKRRASEALDLLGGPEEARARGGALEILATAAAFVQDHRQAAELWARAREEFEKAGAEAEATRARLEEMEERGSLSEVPPENIGREYREVIAELSRRGEESLAALVANNYAVWKIRTGRPEGAEAILREALEHARRSHDRWRIGWVLLNLTDLLLSQGRGSEAEALLSEATPVLERVGDRRARGARELLRGRLLMQRGDWAPAEVALLEASRIARDTGLEADELESLFRLAQLYAHRGDLDRARKILEGLRRRDFPRFHPELEGEVQNLARELSVPPPAGPGGS